MFHLWSQAVLFETLIRVRGSTEDSRKRFCFLAESIFFWPIAMSCVVQPGRFSTTKFWSLLTCRPRAVKDTDYKKANDIER